MYRFLSNGNGNNTILALYNQCSVLKEWSTILSHLGQVDWFAQRQKNGLHFLLNWNDVSLDPFSAPPPLEIFHVYSLLEISNIPVGHVCRLGHYEVVWFKGNDIKKVTNRDQNDKYFSLLWASYGLNSLPPPPNSRHIISKLSSELLHSTLYSLNHNKRLFSQFFFFSNLPTNSIHPYYIRNQKDASLAVSFISHCKITLHVSDAFCVHHQEY